MPAEFPLRVDISSSFFQRCWRKASLPLRIRRTKSVTAVTEQPIPARCRHHPNFGISSGLLSDDMTHLGWRAMMKAMPIPVSPRKWVNAVQASATEGAMKRQALFVTTIAAAMLALPAFADDGA